MSAANRGGLGILLFLLLIQGAVALNNTYVLVVMFVLGLMGLLLLIYEEE